MKGAASVAETAILIREQWQAGTAENGKACYSHKGAGSGRWDGGKRKSLLFSGGGAQWQAGRRKTEKPAIFIRERNSRWVGQAAGKFKRKSWLRLLLNHIIIRRD